MAKSIPLLARLWFDAYLDVYGIAPKDPDVSYVMRESRECMEFGGSFDDFLLRDSREVGVHVAISLEYRLRLPGPAQLLAEARRLNPAILESLAAGRIPEAYVALCRRFDEQLLPRAKTDVKPLYVDGRRGGLTRRDVIAAGWLFANVFAENQEHVFTDWVRLLWKDCLSDLGWPARTEFLPSLSFVAQHAASRHPCSEPLLSAVEARQALLRWMPPALQSRAADVRFDVPQTVKDAKGRVILGGIADFLGQVHEIAVKETGRWLKSATKTTAVERPEKAAATIWDKFEAETAPGLMDAVMLQRRCFRSPWELLFTKTASKTAAECAKPLETFDENGDPCLQGEEWITQTVSSLAAALVTMPRWRAERVSDGLLFWRAVARAGAAVVEASAWRLTGVVCSSVPANQSHLLYAPALEIPEVCAVFESLCAMAAPFEDRLFAFPMGDTSPLRLETRVYAAWMIMTTVAVRDAFLRKPFWHRGTQEVFHLTGALRLDDPAQWLKSYEFIEGLSRTSLLVMSFECAPAFRVDRTEEGGLLLRIGFMQYIRQGTAKRFVAYRDANAEDRRRLLALADSLGELPDAVCGVFKAGNIDRENLTVKVAPGLLADFIFNAIPRLEKHGFFFDTAESFFTLTKPRVVARVTEGEGLVRGLLDKKALSDFSWEAAVGDAVLSRSDLEAVLKRTDEVFSYGDAFLFLTEEDAETIRRQMTAPKRLSVWDKLRAVLSGEVKGVEVMASESLRDKLAALFKAEDVPVPAAFAGELRPYQARGYAWLVKNLSLGLGALIADDMGLGKTVQVIAALQHLKDTGDLEKERVLVVAPASLLINWQREVQRFAPELTSEIYHGASRRMEEEAAASDIVITSYGILQRDVAELSRRSWRLMVLDEAQAVKNAASSRAEAVRLLPVRQVIAMTGTPVENSLSEYWSVLSAVQPGLLGGKTEFMRDYGKPIEERMDRRALERFRQLTAPFILRRVKTDKSVIADLPEKNEIDYFTSLTPHQVKLYEDCLKTGLTDVETLDKEAQQASDATMKAVVQNLRMKRRGSILRMITHLKQIADSPSILTRTTGDEPDSGKGEALLSLISPSLEAGSKILIFTQYAEMGERLARWIEKARGRKPDFLHGGTTLSERQAMTDRFQNDPQANILILTLKAGGTGLNLTAASVVIHYDLWWNPAAESQATDRAYRIGQTKNVLVYRFITAGTFEERIDKLLANKKRLADLTVAGSEKWIGDMTDKELEALFRLA